MERILCSMFPSRQFLFSNIYVCCKYDSNNYKSYYEIFLFNAKYYIDSNIKFFIHTIYKISSLMLSSRHFWGWLEDELCSIYCRQNFRPIQDLSCETWPYKLQHFFKRCNRSWEDKRIFGNETYHLGIFARNTLCEYVWKDQVFHELLKKEAHVTKPSF